MPRSEPTPVRWGSRAHLVGRQAGEQPLGGIGRVIRVGYRSNDDNTAGSGLDHLLDGPQVDTPDSEPRPEDSARADVLGRVTHKLDSDRRTPRLGWRGPDRPDAKVVKPVDHRCRIDLLPRVSGKTDPRCVADNPSSRWSRPEPAVLSSFER